MTTACAERRSHAHPGEGSSASLLRSTNARASSTEAPGHGPCGQRNPTVMCGSVGERPVLRQFSPRSSGPGPVHGVGGRLGRMSSSIYLDRLDRVRTAMAEQGVDVLLRVGRPRPAVPHGLRGDAPGAADDARRAARRRRHAGDPAARGAACRRAARRVRAAPVGRDRGPDRDRRRASPAGASTAAVGDQMWARFLVELLPQLPGTEFRRAVDVVGPLRMVKDAAEIAALAAAGAAADRVADQLHAGRDPARRAHRGRRCRPTSRPASIAEGHDKVNFAIVAAGENAASPHHHAGDRVIAAGEIVLCDFGGTMDGYCSDIDPLRVHRRRPGRDRRGLRRAARGAGRQRRRGGRRHVVRGRRPGGPRHHRRRRLRRAVHPPHRPRHRHGGARGPVHRRGNTLPLEPGHAFSVEPGIYVAGRWGMRLEDIVVATAAGPDALNASDHALVSVDA